MRSMILVPVAGALMTASIPAVAATKQTTMGVSASVAANCIIAAQALSFGSFDASAAKSGSSDLTVRCSNGTPYTVKLSSGATGTFAHRLLTSGSNSLEYNLYTSSALSSIWGDGTASTDTMGGTGAGLAAGSALTHTVYGELPNTVNNQNAPAGNYSDTVTVTVEY
jgi:spore coat protein U-like protein